EAGTPPADGTSCGTGMVCEAGSCVSSQRFCTAVYNISPQMIIEGTPLNIGAGTFALKPSRLELRYEANPNGDGPKAGGTDDVLYWWIRNEFIADAAGIKTDTKVNAYTPRCNGEEVTAAWNPPPATCENDGNTTPMATGTWNAGTVTWAQCNAHPDWNSSNVNAYTP